MLRSILKVLIPIVLASVIIGFVLWRFGVTQIGCADGAGAKIVCKVYIDNEYVGETPFKKRLWIGSYSIKVEPPAGYDPLNQTWSVFAWGVGGSLLSDFDSMKYVARLNAGDASVDIWLEVFKDGKVVGTCGSGDGDGSCDVDLPGPGDYSYTMTEMCEEGDEPCDVKKGSFTIKPENSGTMNLNW